MPIISLGVTGVDNVYGGYLGGSMLGAVLEVLFVLL